MALQSFVGWLNVGVEVDASGVPKQLDKQLSKQSSNIGQKMGGLLATGLKVASGAAVAGIGLALGTALTAGFGRLTAIDNAKKKLEGLKFSAEEVQSTMDSALKAVKGTAFGLGDAATIASIFGATGVKAGEQMTRALKLTADAATVGGTSLADMGDVLSDVSAMGKVTGDTLNRMGERGIDALGMIAREFGVTREEARDMVSEGQVSFDEFASAMEKDIGGAAMRSGETFQGAMANIMAAIGRLGADALGPVFEAVKGAAPAVINAIDGMAAAFKPIFEEVGPQAAGAIKGIGDAIAAVDWTAVAATVKGAWDAVVDVFSRLGDVTSPLLGRFKPIFDAIGDGLGSIDWKVVGDAIVGVWDIVISTLEGVWDALDAVIDQFSPLTDAIGDLEVALEPIPWKEIADGIDSVFGWLADHGDIVVAVLAGIGAAILTSMVPGFIAWISLAPTAIGLFGIWVGTIWAATAAMLANPMTWIIVGVGLLIAAIVLLIMHWDEVVAFITDTWSKFMDWITPVLEGFASWWTDLWEGVTGFFTDVWENIVDWFTGVFESFMGWFTPIWNVIAAVIKLAVDLIVNYFRFWAAVAKWLWENALQPALQAIGDFFGWLWEQAIKPVIDAIAEGFTWLWENGIKPALDAIVAGWEALGDAWQWFLDNVVTPVIDAIAAGFTWLWENGIKPVIDFVMLAIEGWGIIFRWLYDNVIKPVWESIKGAFKSAWDWLDSTVFKPFRDAITGIQTAFQNVADAIPAIWNTIKKAVAEPINFVLDTVWNKGLRSFWNDLVTELDLKDMKLPKAPLVSFAKGGTYLPGYTPGRDVHTFFSPTGGILKMSGGEGIIRPDALRRLGGKRWLDAVNGSRGRIGDGPGEGGKNLVGDAWDWLQDTVKTAWEFIQDPAAAIKRFVIDGIIKPGAKNQNIFGKTIAGVAANFMLGFIEPIKKAAPKSQGTAGMGWEAMAALVTKMIPGTHITSSFRPGAKTVNGGRSFHSLGRAIDIVPASMATFEAVRKLFPNATELIYTPAGNRQLQNGKSQSGWSNAVKQMHYNHVHLAMKNGGIFDNGGWLQPGGLGMNMGKKPEAVFTEAQFKALEQNLVQMDTLLGAVRGYRSPGLLNRNAISQVGAADNSRNLTVESGAFQIAGPDPYAVSLMTVNRLSEMAAL